MIITAIKTQRVTPKSIKLLDLIDNAVSDLPACSVLAITSKVVSLCEGSVVARDSVADKQTLVRQEADLYAELDTPSAYGVEFAIKNHMLMSSAGIDESNGGGDYILWPKNPQATANLVRAHLQKRFGHAELGVIITDSASRPFRRGASGITLAFSGFVPLHSYVGQQDLFGKTFRVEQADLTTGLAAAAVLVMGEGAEATPLAVISELSELEFADRDPLPAELESIRITLESDLYAPFWQKVHWQAGGHTKDGK